MNITYLRYIRRSPQWKAKRQAALQRDGYRCQLWLAHPAEEVHHKTYEHLYDEPLDDLISLCCACHDMITDTVRDERHKQRKLKAAEHQRVGPITQIERKRTQLILSDVLRQLPLPAERITRHGLSLPAVQSYRRRTPDPAQWTDTRPTE